MQQAQQIIQVAMQEAQGQQQPMQEGQEPMQGQEQMMPPQQGMMARGGYFNGKKQYAEGDFLSGLTGWGMPSQASESIPGPWQPGISGLGLENLNPLKTAHFNDELNYPDLTNKELGTPLNLTGWKTPSSSIEGPYQPGVSRPPLKSFDPNEYPGDETTMPDGTIFDGNNYNTQTPLDHALSNQDVLTGFSNQFLGNNSNAINNVSQNGDTPWSKEPWYSKAARYSQVIPGIAATITGMKNKNRKLDPSLMTAQRVNYEPERIVDRKESRRGFNAYADRARNMGNRGYANMKDVLLNSNAALAGRIGESVMREENTNAQLAQQADMTNTGTKNQFKQINEGMFQNAQTQALAGLQDTTGKLAGAAGEERKQYLQEWIAKNRLKTRNYNTADSGQDLYSNNSDGYLYDSNGNRVS
jgi:hypothetical protein